MDFAMLPPEVNSGRIYSGPGAAPMLAAAAAWDALASELHTAGTGYDATISELATGWSGPSATAMSAAASPYVTWMLTTALQAEQTAAQARAAASAYEAAFAMTVPPPVIAANRATLMTLVATNFLGQNTAAIAATEAHYAQMWAQDAAAMYNYAGSTATASVLEPFASAPRTTNPVAAGQAASHAHTAIGQLAAVPNALRGLTAPPAAATALGSASPASPSTLLSTLTPSLGSAAAMAPAAEALVVELFSAFVVDSVGTFGVDAVGTFVIDAAGAVIGEMEALDLPLIGLASWSSPIAAGMGQAASVGALSVPSAWATAVPSAIQQVGTALAAAGTETGPTLGAIPFAPMASAGMAGGATAAAGQAGRGGSGTTKQKRPARPPKPAPTPAPAVKAVPKGPITGISGKLRRLAKLREVGILTEEKFTEKKRLLLDQQRRS